jgi:hypothetical protein
MPNQWTINASGVFGGSHRSDLVGCHIEVNGTAYQFEAPNGTAVSTTTGSTLPTVPFNFPMFNSALAGSTARDWYITVNTLTGGAGGNQAGGVWSNSGFPPGLSADPADTWVAQAGSGLGEDEELPDDEEDTAAASA